MNTWNRQVAINIEGVRADAFSDLRKKENEVLDEVDRAFGNVSRGGTAVHGYLLSLQKVENAQNDLLKEAGLEGLPKKINDALDDASADALRWTEKIKVVDEKANTLKNKVKKVIGG